jgi:hypothetical protein
MMSLIRRGGRPLFALAVATCVAAGTMGALGAGAVVRPAAAGSDAAGLAGALRIRGTAQGASAAPSASQRFATLFFSRSEITAGDNCLPNDQGIARLDTTVAPFLASMGMSATGSLVTGKTKLTAYECTHHGDSLSVSWTQATVLAQAFGWSFVSATGTYPGNLNQLSKTQARGETCGSANTLDNHGLPGAHGLIAYPGAQAPPASIQATDGARCFAWGRVFAKSGTTLAAAGTTTPYWQNTRVLNGGPCNDPSATCYTIPSHGSQRYQEPSTFIALVNALHPGQWLTLQAYVLVTGKNPPYTSNGTKWDCTSSNPALHWTNDVERYCYNDWQQIVNAIAARGNITVTDPLTVGVAFGRPATYPQAARSSGCSRAPYALAGRLTAASAVNTRNVSVSCR